MNESYDENCSNVYDEQTRDNQEQQQLNLGNRSKGDDLMEELLVQEGKPYDSADSYQFRALFRKMISLQWK